MIINSYGCPNTQSNFGTYKIGISDDNYTFRVILSQLL